MLPPSKPRLCLRLMLTPPLFHGRNESAADIVILLMMLSPLKLLPTVLLDALLHLLFLLFAIGHHHLILLLGSLLRV